MSSHYGQLLKDLQTGYGEGEQIVQDFLRKNFGILTSNVGDQHVGWDLEVVSVDDEFLSKSPIKLNSSAVMKKFISKFGRTIEVKRDRVSDRTGNFFYEVWSNMRVHNPGCISTSKADTIVIVRNDEFIFVNRSFFISWVVYNLYMDTDIAQAWRKKTRGKKKNNSGMRNSPVSPHVRGVLIPIEDIKIYSSIQVFNRI
jgi:hypothetical protein